MSRDFITPPPPAARVRRALIVEDEESLRLILTALLSQLGYETVDVDNGADAVARFSPRQFDLVLMDLVMPGMDGFRTTQLIKSLCRDYFVPVLIITGLTDEATFSRCIECGGDDVLHKPFEMSVLRSKVRALQRIRDLHEELGALLFRMKRNEDGTDKLYQHAIAASTPLVQGISFETRSAGRFNGDVFVHERGPNGELHLLLGDFAGHGLTTAMAALPTVETFRSMVAKGFQARDVVAHLNNKLFALLPDQMFLAAVYIHIPLERGTINVINCGLPEVLGFDTTNGTILHRIASRYLPLGVVNAPTEPFDPERMIVSDKIGVFACTDGLLDALAQESRASSDASVARSLMANSPFALTSGLLTQLGDGVTPFIDDLSMLAFRYDAVIEQLAPQGRRGAADGNNASHRDVTCSDGTNSSLRYGMHLSGATLKRLDPIPLLVHPLHDLPELTDQLGNIYTILTELFVNALDHGVLGLDSAIKAGEDGFARYFQLRDERLANLDNGFIDVQIDVSFNKTGGSVGVAVTDSGAGFAHSAVFTADVTSDATGVSGRGTGLLRELCRSLTYHGNGNEVHALYRW